MAKRIQLSRKQGWRLPEGAVSVARPGRWGNPYSVSGAIEHGFADTEAGARRVAVEFYRRWLLRLDPADPDVILSGKRTYDRRWAEAHIGDLAGRDLACWCDLADPCHASVLLAIAAGESS